MWNDVEPGDTGCFWSLIIRQLLPPNPDEADLLWTMDHFSWSRAILSGASVMFLMAVFICCPMSSRCLSDQARDLPSKPLQPSSVGLHWVHHPFPWHSSTSSLPFFFHRLLPFNLSRGQSDQTGPLVLMLMTSSVVPAMTSGNLSCVPRLTLNCQSWAVESSPPEARGWGNA